MRLRYDHLYMGHYVGMGHYIPMHCKVLMYFVISNTVTGTKYQVLDANTVWGREFEVLDANTVWGREFEVLDANTVWGREFEVSKFQSEDKLAIIVFKWLWPMVMLCCKISGVYTHVM